MTPKEREAYWKLEIVFDCPLMKQRHTIDECFNHCEFSGISYHDGAGYIKCLVDSFGEREVHNGRITRDD